MNKEYFFRIFLKGDKSGKSVEIVDTEAQAKLYLEDNLIMDLLYEEWEMNPDGSEIKLSQKVCEK